MHDYKRLHRNNHLKRKLLGCPPPNGLPHPTLALEVFPTLALTGKPPREGATFPPIFASIADIMLILRSQKLNILSDELEKHYTLKIDLFVKIAPHKFRLKNQGTRDVILRKSIVSSRSPLRNFVLNISTSPPTARGTENF